jgi:hypothetical protein
VPIRGSVRGNFPLTAPQKRSAELDSLLLLILVRADVGLYRFPSRAPKLRPSMIVAMSSGC